MSDTNHDLYLALDASATQESLPLLQKVLANSLIMRSLYKKYHWHVTGIDFYQYHLLFDKHADEQLPIIDAVAERIRTLGGKAAGMPNEVVQNASVKEPNDPGSDCQAMVRNLLVAHEQYMRTVRDAIRAAEAGGDAGTEDLMVSEVLRVHELEAWFIRSSLKTTAEHSVS